MWRDWLNHKQALSYVRDKHHVAFPNEGFMEQVRLWGEAECDFSDTIGNKKHLDYVFGEERVLEERVLRAAYPDHLPRPHVRTDLLGVTRPADPHRRREPQPAPEPARRWFSLR